MPCLLFNLAEMHILNFHPTVTLNDAAHIFILTSFRMILFCIDCLELRCMECSFDIDIIK